jgi:hypothetical protein
VIRNKRLTLIERRTELRELKALWEIVCKEYGHELRTHSPKRFPLYVKMRHAFFYVAKKHANIHEGLIGEFIGRDRSTVITGCNKCEEDVALNPLGRPYDKEQHTRVGNIIKEWKALIDDLEVIEPFQIRRPQTAGFIC